MKGSKYWFEIKGTVLYYYRYQNSHNAYDEIDIEKLRRIELDPNNDKVFYVITRTHSYKLEASSRNEVIFW